MDARTHGRTDGWIETLFGLRLFFLTRSPAVSIASRCFAHQVVVPHAKHFSTLHISQFMISMVSNDLHSGPWYPSLQSLSFYNHSLSFFKSSGSPSFQFCTSPLSLLQDLLSPSLFPFWLSALAFGHLASFPRKLRPSISLFRTLLVPPIISVRTLYQEVMPECVDSGSSHSVHSSVVVLGWGLHATADSQALPNWLRVHVFCSLHHFSACVVSCHSSGPPSSLREVPDVPQTETFDRRFLHFCRTVVKLV